MHEKDATPPEGGRSGFLKYTDRFVSLRTKSSFHCGWTLYETGQVAMADPWESVSNWARLQGGGALLRIHSRFTYAMPVARMITGCYATIFLLHFMRKISDIHLYRNDYFYNFLQSNQNQVSEAFSKNSIQSGLGQVNKVINPMSNIFSVSVISWTP